MTNQNEFPEWVHVGATVAIMQPGGWGAPSVTLGNVDRMTATQVIVGPRRFKLTRFDGIEEMGSNKYYRAKLYYPLDIRVIEWQREEAIEALRSTAHGAVDKWLKSRDDTGLASLAAEALRAYVDGATE
jgi:hypothetical protein